MRIWIDATRPNSVIPFLGMTVLEYQLKICLQSERQIQSIRSSQPALNGITLAQKAFERSVAKQIIPSEIRIELPDGAPIPKLSSSDVIDKLPIKWSQSSAPLVSRLQEYLVEADGDPVIALAADAVTDVRVFEDIVWGATSRAFVKGEGEERSAIARLDAPLRDPGEGLQTFVQIIDDSLDSGTVKGPVLPFDEGEFQTWIGKLRRTLPAFQFAIPNDAAAAKVEHFLFKSNYKGATDFMTRYVYPPLVWALVKPCARRKISPNMVTGVSIVATFAAIPFFAAAMWVPGLILAYTMSVLDSVDGKLARLTFTSSRQGDTLDHGLDTIHPPLWYFAWAWGLSGGDPYSSLVQASGIWFLLYVMDRILETLFKSSTGQSIHGYRKIDVRVRTFLSRRNVNLAIFTIALPLGLGTESFFLMVTWQAACVLFHLARVIQYWDADLDAPGAVPGS